MRVLSGRLVLTKEDQVIEYDVERARQAVQLLVHVSHFNDYVKTIKRHTARPRAFPYKGEKEVLNELLRIGRQNEKALDRLLAIAEFKRGTKNERQGEYQRAFMAAKRQRDLKAIRFEEVVQGKKLSLDERRLLLLKQYEVWNKEKAEYLNMHGKMDWKDRNAAIADFWKMKEQELDQLIVEAEAAQTKHMANKKRRVVVVTQPKQTAMRMALGKALDKRR